MGSALFHSRYAGADYPLSVQDHLFIISDVYVNNLKFLLNDLSLFLRIGCPAFSWS